VVHPTWRRDANVEGRDFIHIKRGDDEVIIRGFFRLSQGETKMTTNNSINVNSIVGDISQNSPHFVQSINAKVSDLQSALADFSETIKTASLPTEKLDEILSDVATIRAQLSKRSPSGGIIQEATKSIRNVIEGVAAGLITPEITASAVALFGAVGLS